MDSSQILMMLNEKLPKDNPMVVQALSEELKSLDSKQLDSVMQGLTVANLKSPSLVFWVGSFMFGSFGVGRFMIGDSVIGAVRLCITIAYIICLMVSSTITSEIITSDYASEEMAVGAIGWLIIGCFLGFVAWVWWIVDLFLVGKKLRNQNMQKVQQVIMSVKKG